MKKNNFIKIAFIKINADTFPRTFKFKLKNTFEKSAISLM